MFLAARMADVRARGLLEADFAEYYHLDLLGELGDGLTVAHAATLAANLPPASRTFRDLDARLSWTTTDYLLALVADQLACLRYESARLAGARNVRRPKPIQRPGTSAKPHRKAVSVPKARLDRILFAPRTKAGELDPEEVERGI